MVKQQIITKHWDSAPNKMIISVEEVSVPNKADLNDIATFRMRKQFDSYFKDR